MYSKLFRPLLCDVTDYDPSDDLKPQAALDLLFDHRSYCAVAQEQPVKAQGRNFGVSTWCASSCLLQAAVSVLYASARVIGERGKERFNRGER